MNIHGNSAAHYAFILHQSQPSQHSFWSYDCPGSLQQLRLSVPSLLLGSELLVKFVAPEDLPYMRSNKYDRSELRLRQLMEEGT